MKRIAILLLATVMSIAVSAKNKAESTADAIAKYEAGGKLERDASEKVVDAPEGMKLILCIGQSNMAGRAKMSDEDREEVKGAYKLNRDDEWVVAKAPYHFDKKVAAVGPVDEFVKLYLKEHPGENVGVVPCAVGGSSVKTWMVSNKGKAGRNLETTLKRIKSAAKKGKFIAILWHQGETDAAKWTEEQIKNEYVPAVATVAKAVRELTGEDVPFIVGEIGHWPRKDGDFAAKINPVINEIPKAVSKCAAVSAEGLKSQDPHHFNREGQRVLGSRYYDAWKKIGVVK